ncbi:hypothetical protein SeMB42_g05408 [Synchytrium endobioticum]|uniref:Spc7 kinetochore protein domain-containing protein n=1 Tax=Synchytrium endobioticum TaxID=286115 RepID=A0A507CRK1_9FUNG|nr:hypothetical protein SeMB42_g05408 [Synchytrium endobioticum]
MDAVSPRKKRRATITNMTQTAIAAIDATTTTTTTTTAKRRRSIMKQSSTSNNDKLPAFDDVFNMDAENTQPTSEGSQDSSGKERAKPRKSLGRRVSFAATAHVRLFDKEEWPTPARARIDAKSHIELPSALPTPENKTTFDLPDLSSVRRTSDTYDLQLSLDTSQVSTSKSVSDDLEMSFEVDVKGTSPDKSTDTPATLQQNSSELLASEPSPSPLPTNKIASAQPLPVKPSPSSKKSTNRRDTVSQFFSHSPQSPRVAQISSQTDDNSPLLRRSPRLAKELPTSSPSGPSPGKVEMAAPASTLKISPGKSLDEANRSKTRDSVAAFFQSPSEDDTFRNVIGNRFSSTLSARPRDSVAPFFQRESRNRARDSIAPFFQNDLADQDQHSISTHRTRDSIAPFFRPCQSVSGDPTVTLSIVSSSQASSDSTASSLTQIFNALKPVDASEPSGDSTYQMNHAVMPTSAGSFKIRGRPRDSLAPFFVSTPSICDEDNGDGDAASTPTETNSHITGISVLTASQEVEIGESEEGEEPDVLLSPQNFGPELSPKAKDDDDEDEDNFVDDRVDVESIEISMRLKGDEKAQSNDTDMDVIASPSKQMRGDDEEGLNDGSERFVSDETSMIDLQEISMDLNTSCDVENFDPLGSVLEGQELIASSQMPLGASDLTTQRTESQAEQKYTADLNAVNIEIADSVNEPSTPRVTKWDSGMTPLGKLASAVKLRAQMSELTRRPNSHAMRGNHDLTPISFPKHKVDDGLFGSGNSTLDSARFESLLRSQNVPDTQPTATLNVTPKRSRSSIRRTESPPPQSPLTLSSFLSDTGTSFNEPSLTPARRRTIRATPRSSIGDVDVLVAGLVVEPEYDLYLKINEELVSETSRLANILQGMEDEAAENPPLLFADYQSGSVEERSNIKNNVHLTKQYAKLTSSMEHFKKDQARLSLYTNQTKALLRSVEAHHHTLKITTDATNERLRQRQEQEVSRMNVLKNQLSERRAEHQELETQLSTAQQTLNAVKSELVTVVNELSETAEAIVEAEKKCEENKPIYATDIQHLRDEFNLIGALSLWSPAKITSNSIKLVYDDKINVEFISNLNNSLDVAISVTSPSTLDMVSNLVKASLPSYGKVSSKGATKVLEMVTILNDSACALMHDVYEAQTVTKVDVSLNLTHRDNSVVSLQVLLFSKRARTRCRVNLMIPLPLEYPKGAIDASVTCEYGAVNEEKLNQILVRNSSGPDRLLSICKELLSDDSIF